MASIISLAFALLVAHSPAIAECPFLGAAIQNKIDEYKVFRQKNELTLKSLLETKTTCETRGAGLSSKIAEKASALSCQAELDASGMDRELRDLGTKCEKTFTQIHDLQIEIKMQFELLKNDLDEGFAFMKINEILLEHCMPEIKVTQKTVAAFVELELSIVEVESKALDGQDNYGKFSLMAQQLHKETATRGGNCGELTSSLAAIARPGLGEGGPQRPGKKGLSPRSASDITGTNRSELAAKAGGVKLERPKLPDSQRTEAPVIRRKGTKEEITMTFGKIGTLGAQSAAGGRSIASTENRAHTESPPASLGAVLWDSNGPEEESKFALKGAPTESKSAEPAHAPTLPSPVPLEIAPLPTSMVAAAQLSPSTKVLALGELTPEQVSAIAAETTGSDMQLDLFTRVRLYYRHSSLNKSPAAGLQSVAQAQGLQPAASFP